MADNTTNVKVAITSDDSSAKAIAAAFQRASAQLDGSVKGLITSIAAATPLVQQLASKTGRKASMVVSVPVMDGDTQVGTVSAPVTGLTPSQARAAAIRNQGDADAAAHRAFTAPGHHHAQQYHALKNVLGDPASSEDALAEARAGIRALTKDSARARAIGNFEDARTSHKAKWLARFSATGRRDVRTDAAVVAASMAADPASFRKASLRVEDELRARESARDASVGATNEDRAARDAESLRARAAKLEERRAAHGVAEQELFGGGRTSAGLTTLVDEADKAPTLRERRARNTAAREEILRAEQSSATYDKGIANIATVSGQAESVREHKGRIKKSVRAALVAEVDQLERDMKSLTPHEAAGAKGQAIVKRSAQLAKDAKDSREARERRGLFGGAGVMMAGRRIGQGIEAIGGSIFTPGGLASMPGQMMRTGGGVMQDLGFARLASGAAGGAALAIGGMALGAVGAIVSAGISKGYERSESADKIYQGAVPFYERVKLDRELATRGVRGVVEGGGLAAAEANYAARRKVAEDAAISERLKNRYYAGVGDQRQYVRDNADTLLTGRFAPHHFERDLSPRELSVAKAATTEARVAEQLKHLARLDFVDPSLAGRQKMAESFYARAGVAGLGLGSIVGDIGIAHHTGLNKETAADMVRLGALTGKTDINQGNPLGAAFMAAGVTGTPRDAAVRRFFERDIAARSAGFRPDTKQGMAFARTYLDSDGSVKDVDVTRAQDRAGSMRDSIYQELYGNVEAQVARNMMIAESFRGRTYEEAGEFLSTSDPTTVVAEFLHNQGLSEGDPLARMAMRAFDPANSAAMMKTLSRLTSGDIPAEDTAGMSRDAFMRNVISGKAETDLIGQARNIEHLDTIADMKRGLYSAADSLRQVADSFASGAAGMFAGSD